MRYLLDSNSLSDLYDSGASGHAAVARRLQSLADADQVVVSILALYEVEYGHANAPDEMKAPIRQRISHMRAAFALLPLTADAALLYGELKVGLSRARGLRAKGSKLHNIDVMLAATAIAEDCILISGDSIYGDLQRIHPALRVEDWLL